MFPYWNAPCGIEASADFATVRKSVEKYANISPAFEAQAKRREADATSALSENRLVAARENLLHRSDHLGAAQWPIDHDNTTNRRYNERKGVLVRSIR